MAGEWQSMTAAQAFVINPRIQPPRAQCLPFVDMAAIDCNAQFVEASQARGLTGGSRFEHGDTLMARITPCLENGKIARFRSIGQHGFGFGSTEFIVFRGRDGVTTSDFAFYTVKSQSFRDFAISQMSGTSGRQRVPTACFEHLHLSVPPLAIQDSITGVLSALDVKIENNRRALATLEEMARALFKSWFVDFDPVHAKAEGRDAGLPADIAALFPDAFGDAGLPRGWTWSVVGEFMNILDSKRVPLSARERETRRGNIPYHGATGVMDFIDDHLFDEVLLLVGEDGSVVKPDGKPFTQYVWGKVWVNNHAHVIRGRGVATEHLKCFFEQVYIAPFITGAVQPKLNQANMKDVPFVSAPETINEQFGELIGSYFASFRSIAEENKALTDIRDQIMPQLLSGELRVEDVEEQIAAA